MIEQTFAEGFQGLLAGLVVEMVDEQDTIEMVEFVLEQAAQQLVCLERDLIPLKVVPGDVISFGRTISHDKPGTERQPSS